MEAPVRYAALFLSPERTPENYWISLRYFNLYRIALAALFLGISLAYGELNLGSHNLALFRGVSAAYLVLGVAFDAVLRNHRENFNMRCYAQLPVRLSK